MGVMLESLATLAVLAAAAYLLTKMTEQLL